MGDILDLILDIGEFRKKYGTKGCLWLALGTLVVIGGIILLAASLQ